jgi:hypothetical protein
MTSTIGRAEILKQDGHGRVRVPAGRRESLLDEFEKSGASGAQFARLTGIKYATFAGWVLKRRKQRASLAKVPLDFAAKVEDAVVSTGAVRLFEV